MSRPKKDLTEKEWASVDYMITIHCTGEEIAGVLGMDYDTLNRNSKEQKGMPISEYIKQGTAKGKMSLRRMQWKSAENGNTTMQIWLGKQWLGQKDTIANDVKVMNVNDEVKAVVDNMINEYEQGERNSNLDD